MVSDEVYSKKEILIPVQPGMKIQIAEPESEQSKRTIEEQTRAMALRMLNDHIRAKNMAPKS